MEKTVTEQFNRQQLILARKIANNISNHFNFLGTSLRRFNQFWERGVKSTDKITTYFTSVFELLTDWHVLVIGHLDREGKIPVVVSEKGLSTDKGLSINYDSYWQWGIKPENRGKIIIGRTFRPDTGLFKGRRLVTMAAPIWQPTAPQKGEEKYYFEGLNFLVVDPVGIAQRYARDVRSGETGYAWVVDHKGIFLSHYEATFIGEDSFTVRHKTNPNISYARVSQIVRKHMLKGEEGTDWYISGWHRGIIGEMKKLFAYSPIVLSRERDSGNLWSVGVTAPETEVYGIVQSLVIKQWLIAGVFQLVVFLGLAASIYLSLRWSRILQTEVDEKTADLRRSEAAVRRERDTVKESMQKLVETQEKLIRAERFAAIGEAASYISHEIKNPLVAIGGFARQVERSFSPDDENIKKLRTIIEETGRLESMLTDVRDFTRPSSLKKELKDINLSIKETLSLMEDTLTAMGINYDKLLDDKLPPIWFDPEQIKQVMINLIKNASEAMSEGKITIMSRQEGDYIKVSISDTGAGMSAEMVEKIFEPFFTTKRKGTGLGLAVCRKIIEDHAGELAVESTEGKGTKFTISLPIEKG
jgi:two-component system sensor histidine kinase HydH